MLWFYMHFGSDCGCILVSFSEQSGMQFSDVFLDVFLVAFGTNMDPKASQNASGFSKKKQNCALLFRSGAPDSILQQFWIHFGRHLIHFGSHLRRFGYLLVVI